ncbi:hypothetical protein [Citrobacter koseri]|uniref:hypothetical protein n=1 Tax=Citrobacter koseri TaxID=545 RepID=UPI000DF0F5C1|nr:hypothetical protein [Citrobacter koseri]STB29460.1 Uncharacterised protein [Citrobacter koseri]
MALKKVTIKGGSADGQSFMHEVSSKPDDNGAYGYIEKETSSLLSTKVTYFIEKDESGKVDTYFVDFTKPH